MKTRAQVGTRAEAAAFVEAARTAGKTVGFTSGVFDLLHLGHVEYLEAARRECDVLVVAVNSDASVRSYKEPQRPIVPEATRAALLAHLASVDFVFVFEERANRENIEALRPAIYFKAGDYTAEKLSSAPLVESYGGKVRIVPFRSGQSTTSLVETVLERYGHRAALAEEVPARTPRPAVFLDRDGVINEHVEYLHEVEKFKLVPGVIEGLRKLRDLGYLLVVVTNQPAIGLGYCTREEFFKVNTAMLRQLSSAGVYLDKIYFCPHRQGEGCACRKPATGMIERAFRELSIVREKSYMIGDYDTDIECGTRMGLRAIRIVNHTEAPIAATVPGPTPRCANLLEAVKWIERSEDHLPRS